MDNNNGYTAYAMNDEALAQVVGGSDGVLDRIMEEVNCWLEHHPDATQKEIYELLRCMADRCWSEMTPEEHQQMQQLLDAFIA